MTRRLLLPAALFLALAAAVLVPLAAAQEGGQAHVHIHDVAEPQSVNTSGGAVGLSLQTSFSLLDGSNQIMTAFEIVDATVELEGNSFTAVVQELETPWTIVVLVDSSKTLGSFTESSTAKAAREGLASAVGGVPENTNIAVMTFDDSAQTRFEFSQEKNKAAQAVAAIRPRTAGNSCLNNGLYEAVNKLSGAPGRRAVMLFTASSDNCATRTPQDVLDLAEANRVEIYGVGLQGYSITSAELQAVTEPTGGLAELRTEGTLGFGFSNMMGLLNNQWTARATVYPSAGEQEATLVVNLADESSLRSTPISFTSAQDYIPPTEIRLLGNVQSLADGVLFNLDLTQPEKIRQLNVNIVSKDTGQSVVSQTLTNFSDVNTVPTASLEPGLEYTLTVVAIDFEGQTLSETQAEFEYEPPQAGLIVSEIVPPEPGREVFEVSITTQNLGDAVKFRAWMIDAQSESKIEGTEVTVPLGETIEISAAGLRAGEYAIFVQALDPSDTVLAESPPAELVYDPPGMFQRLSNWASNSPVALTGLTALCCLTSIGLAALVWFVLPKNRGEREADVDLIMPDRGQPKRPLPGRPVSRKAAPPESAEEARAKVPRRPPVREAPPEKPRKKPQPPVKKRPPAGTKPSARLTLAFPQEPDFAVQMTSSPFRVGRRESNEGALPLDSSTGVSGEHLVILFEEGRYLLRDDKSTYGTTIDGEEVPKGKTVPLEDGARIGLGPMVKLDFEVLKNE